MARPGRSMLHRSATVGGRPDPCCKPTMHRQADVQCDQPQQGARPLGTGPRPVVVLIGAPTPVLLATLRLQAFVYSTFPTAPGVLAFSLQYGVEPVAVASMVVLCTLLSAPIMYVSAKLAMLSDNEADVRGTTSQMAVALSTISAVACAVRQLRHRVRPFSHPFISSTPPHTRCA